MVGVRDGPSIVIVGGGYAGSEAARRLGDRAEVTLISDENFLLFTPMLAEVAAGEIEPRHIISPLRHLCPKARVVVGDVTSIDVAGRSVAVVPGLGSAPVVYRGDVLVLTAGSVPATFGIPGVEEHTIGFKSILDALRIRRRVIALLEAAAEKGDPLLTTFAIVGAGYVGSELAAGLADFLDDAMAKFYPTAPGARIILIDAVDRVAPTLPTSLSDSAARALRRRGVELRLGRRVTSVESGAVSLDDGSTIEAGTIIWSTGVRAAPLADATGLGTRKGRLIVDGNMRAAPGVFAAGDIAAVSDGRGSICPPTAQHALRHGRYLGENLVDLAAGNSVPPFRYKTMGQLVSLGRRNAVGTVMGLKVSGFIGWFLWRTYYWWRLPTFLRKVRVAMDWSLDLVFPPDVAGLPSADLGPMPGGSD